MGQTEEIEAHEWDVDDSWSEGDENKKQSYYNDAAEDLENQLKAARELVQKLWSEDVETSAVIGQLISIAYTFNATAKQRALMEEEEVPESIEMIEKEILDALSLEDGREFSPGEVKRMSEEVSGTLGRAPSPLQDLLDENGTKLDTIVSIAFAGTEVMTEGSSEDEADRGDKLI